MVDENPAFFYIKNLWIQEAKIFSLDMRFGPEKARSNRYYCHIFTSNFFNNNTSWGLSLYDIIKP